MVQNTKNIIIIIIIVCGAKHHKIIKGENLYIYIYIYNVCHHKIINGVKKHKIDDIYMFL